LTYFHGTCPNVIGGHKKSTIFPSNELRNDFSWRSCHMPRSKYFVFSCFGVVGEVEKKKKRSRKPSFFNSMKDFFFLIFSNCKMTDLECLGTQGSLRGLSNLFMGDLQKHCNGSLPFPSHTVFCLGCPPLWVFA
jgi:hypothetical protein